jgi:hypothetical protein
MAKKTDNHKPVIETIINTAAIALSAFGVVQVQGGDYLGLCLIAFAAGLEFFKYWGRKKLYW